MPHSPGRTLFEEDDSETAGQPAGRKLISIVVAILLSASLLLGFLLWRKRYGAERAAAEQQAQPKTVAPPSAPAKVQVYLDEALNKGHQALVGGTVHNISNETLSGLRVEVELVSRKEGGNEVRALELEPGELRPDQKGRYSLMLSRDYRSVKLLRIKTDSAPGEVAFKTAPGAARPPERAPEVRGTVVIQRPQNRSDGEEFINTPDNPSRVP
ncbi:MAG TPA: hypothetical protein VF723_18025 [Pyrinomonadaceae bacterium]|jgi:hypothetical protein